MLRLRGGLRQRPGKRGIMDDHVSPVALRSSPRVVAEMRADVIGANDVSSGGLTSGDLGGIIYMLMQTTCTYWSR